MMRTSLAVVALASLVALGASQGTYTTQYDNIDVDAILNNDRTLTSYFNCLTEQGPCTPDGKALRESIPDALATGCAKCSDTHKAQFNKIMGKLKASQPDKLKAVIEKFDPTGDYRKKYGEYFERL